MGAAREGSDALGCNSGIGAVETKQQDVFDAATVGVRLSSMFIWSHRDCVFCVAHSASLDEKSAQAESRIGPSPARLTTNANMNDRRITCESTTQIACEAFNATISVMVAQCCETDHTSK